MAIKTVNYQISEIDALTGEVINREMTNEERKQRDLDYESEVKELERREIQAVAKQSAQTKLAALGLTADEVAAILGN